MNKLFNYFRDHYFFYLFAFLNIFIFYFILYLYDALVAAINYATLLSIVIIIIYFVIDFYRYNKRSDQLAYLLKLDNFYLDNLPTSNNQIEKYYQDILIKVEQANLQLKNFQDNNYNEMLDYFTLWVHQIKTPIAALRLLIQSLDNQSDLLLQVLKIEQYVNMVIHYLKIDHMSSDLSLKYYSLDKIINDVIKKQAPFFIYKKIKLELDPINLNILTDEKWLSFVLEQILSNALKYTKTGSIHIYVKDETLYIQDTGIGIKAEDLPRIFEKGYTGYNGRIDKKASGLGLYLCKQVVDNLGYHLEINSKLKEGTTVAINIHINKLEVE